MRKDFDVEKINVCSDDSMSNQNKVRSTGCVAEGFVTNYVYNLYNIVVL